jgi:hypothetical protein
MRTVLIVLMFLVLLFGLPSCCCIQGFDLDMEGYKSEFDRTYAMDPGGRVEVKNIDGLVRVGSWDRNEVLVEGTLRVKAKDEEEARNRMKEIKVIVTQDEDLLSIQIKRKRAISVQWFEYGSWRVDLELTVPRECNLSISSVDGRIQVGKVDGDHELNAVDGSVLVESMRGDLKARTVDGSCTVVDVRGDVSLNTTDGYIEVDRVLGNVTCESVDGPCTMTAVEGRVSVNAVDGRVRIGGVLSGLSASSVNGSIGIAAHDGSVVTDGWTISTSDGSITLKLPKSLSADLRASTVDGHVSLSVPAEFDVKTKRRVVAALGKGGGVINVSTTDGSVRIGYLESE